jgi:hypothetical protein
MQFDMQICSFFAMTLDSREKGQSCFDACPPLFFFSFLRIDLLTDAKVTFMILIHDRL